MPPCARQTNCKQIPCIALKNDARIAGYNPDHDGEPHDAAVAALFNRA